MKYEVWFSKLFMNNNSLLPIPSKIMTVEKKHTSWPKQKIS